MIGKYEIIEGRLTGGDRRSAYAVTLVEPVDAPNAWGKYPTERELAKPAQKRPVASFWFFSEGVKWATEQLDG